MDTKEKRYDDAIALKDQDKITEAMAALEQLCVDFPEYALPHAALSMWYFRREDFAKSLEHAERVCELEPEDPFSFTALSALAIKSGDHALAEVALGKAREAHLNYLAKEQEKQEAENHQQEAENKPQEQQEQNNQKG